MADSTKVKLLYAIGFVDIFAFSLFMPLLFDYFISLKISHFTIGLLGSLHSGLQLISGPIVGSWSDVRGHSSILQLTLLVSATFYFILGSTTIFPIILLSRIVHGLCEHTQALCGTLLAETASSNKQSEVQGRMASTAGIAFMIGPIIGGHLAEQDNGFQYVCYLVSVALLINFVIVRFFLTTSSNGKNKKKKKTVNKTKPPKINSENSKKSFSSEIFSAITNLKNINWPLYWDIFLLKFFCDFTSGLHYQSFRIVLMEIYQITPTWIGYSMAVFGMMGAVTGFLNGWITKLYKDDQTHAHKAFHCCIAFALSFLLTAVAPSFQFVMMSLVLLSASSSLLGITITEIILSRTDPDKRGSILGTSQSILSLSFLMTPITSGVVYEFYGNDGMSVFKVITAILTLILSLLLFRKKTKAKKKSS